jgi:choice-of-anchor B domain-containing protein
MKKLLSVFFVLSFILLLPAQKNISLLGHLSYGNQSCSNLTGYADAQGREYALVGTTQGLSIVAIDTPTNPRQLFLVPGATGNSGLWREVREYKGYAYVTTEQASGLVIVNLNYLPDSIKYHTVRPNNMSTSHTVFIDSNGIAYINGTDKGQLFLDLNTDPYNPTYLGKYTNNYVHDCYVRNDTMWAACINDGFVQVIDVHNKTTADNPANLLAQWYTPLSFAHNCWLSDDSRYLFTTDEKPNSTLTCYEVNDLNNVTETDKTQVQPGTNTIIHNTYFLNNYCATSYYTYGVALFDVTRKNNLIETGNFDTSPDFSGDGFDGQWGVWPYLPSGNIICSDIETGLWVLKPTYKRAAYLEGEIRDSICQTLLNGVKVEILTDSVTDYTNYLGLYTTGTVDSGSYTVRFSKNGYQTVDVPNVHLVNGVLTTINLNLLPVSTAKLVIKTTDENGNALANANVLIKDMSGTTYQQITTGSTGYYSYCDFVQGTYDFYAGKWGRLTAKITSNVTTNNDTIELTLPKGYYDDFIMNFGWTVNSTATKGIWVKAEPVVTDYQGTDCNPGTDIVGDYGTECYVTGNGGGNAGDDDIDNGYTTLSSPVFDLSTYTDPYLSYYRWFFNDGGNGSAPNDSLKVYLSNGADTVLIDLLNADSVQSQWRLKKIRISDFMFPTANMKLFLNAADTDPGHLVEAGLDVFQVIDSGTTTGVKNVAGNTAGMFVYPNPFTNQIAVTIPNALAGGYDLQLTNTLGATILKHSVAEVKETIQTPADLSAGIYFLKLTRQGVLLQTLKIVCTR